MSSKSLYILWDESHIWGLLAWRAALGYGLEFRVISAQDVAGGLLQASPPAALLVPGGNARLKAEALGTDGLSAIRSYVKNGGNYLGFCGGCGLGLSVPEPEQGKPTRQSKANGQAKAASKKTPVMRTPSLGLSPWTRGQFDDRIQHFMSGHLHATLEHAEHEFSPLTRDCGSACKISPAPEPPLLPVWWPARFLPGSEDEVNILARYAEPGADFWLTDLPIASLPQGAFSDWQALYGINLSPAFLEGQPCVIYGQYGQGAYILSYSHLETPASPFANCWLAHILTKFGCGSIQTKVLPAWKLEEQPILWDDKEILCCLELVQSIMQTGTEHALLFKRNDWLYGWRTGMPGSSLNNLHAALHTLVSLPPAKQTKKLWDSTKAEIIPQMNLFTEGVTNYLLAERLAMTLAKHMPEAVSPKLLQAQRHSLFGPPMHASGLYSKLMPLFDQLALLQIQNS